MKSQVRDDIRALGGKREAMVFTQRILAMRAEGFSFHQIAENLSINKRTVEYLYRSEVRRTTRFDQDIVGQRSMQVGLLDGLLVRTMDLLKQVHQVARLKPKRAQDGRVLKDDNGAIILDPNSFEPISIDRFVALSTLVLRISHRKSALLGLNQPVNVMLEIGINRSAEEARLEEKLKSDPQFRDRFIETVYGQAGLPSPESGGVGEGESVGVDDALGRIVDGSAGGVPAASQVPRQEAP